METKEDKTKKYEERHRFWTDKAFGQLSMSIEVMFALTVGVLGFILSNDKISYNCCSCCCHCACNLKTIVLLISIATIVLSIFWGLLSMISRNLDLRLTRHVTYLRKKNHENINSEEIDSVNFGWFKLLEIFFCDYKNIESGEYANPNFMKRFKELRGTTKCLGKLTWRYNKYQIVFLFVGIVSYVVCRLVNT